MLLRHDQGQLADVSGACFECLQIPETPEAFRRGETSGQGAGRRDCGRISVPRPDPHRFTPVRESLIFRCSIAVFELRCHYHALVDVFERPGWDPMTRRSASVETYTSQENPSRT
jgi:hypothetical protein